MALKRNLQLFSTTTRQQGCWRNAALETRRFCGRPAKITLKTPVREAGGKFVAFLARTRMVETWRVEGGLTAPRVGFGDFALNPQEKITSSKRHSSNYKKCFLILVIQD
jgi:hypothetical protein